MRRAWGSLAIASFATAIQAMPIGNIDTVAGGGGGDGGVATSAPLSAPAGVALDGSGRLFLSDTGNGRVRMVQSDGTIHTLWSASVQFVYTTFPVYYQGPAHCPTDMAFDPAGNLLFLDGCAGVVRKIDAGTGAVSTFAGKAPSTPLDPLGDNGPATDAALYVPSAMAVDSAGNVFLSETYQRRVRKISGGIITTLAGSTYGSSDPTQVQAAALGADNVGGVYAYLIEDWDGSVRKRLVHFDAHGVRTVVAGDGSTTNSGDGGPASAAGLGVVQGIAADAAGGIVLTFADRIRRIAPDRTIATIATVGAGKILPTGSSFVATAGDTIVRIDPPSTTTPLAGNVNPFYGDGGSAVAAGLNSPTALVADRSGVLYIADAGNNRIRKVDASGVITTFAGNGSAGFGGDGGPATAAQLSYPAGVALDAAGNLYVADRDNHRVRRIDTSGVITTVAGTGTAGFSADGGPATAAQLDLPQAVAIDAGGNLIIGDTGNLRVRKVTPAGTISTIAGMDSVKTSFGESIIVQPDALAIDPQDNVLIANAGSMPTFVWRVGNGMATNLAGTGYPNFMSLTGVSSFNLMSTRGIAVDAAGTIYLSDWTLSRIFAMTSPGAPGRIVAGGASCDYYHTVCGVSFAGDGGPATAAGLNDPQGLFWDEASGNLYIADSGNDRIRAIKVAEARPLPFAIAAQSGVAPATPVVSATITPTGYSAPTPIAVANGEYSIGCTGTFATAAGTINPGQSVCVRQTAAPLNNAHASSVLTIGGVSATFTTQTALAVGSASFSTSSLDFGSQSMNTSDGSQSVTITNTGSSPMSLAEIDSSSGVTLTHDCTNVAAASTCTITLSFAPTAVGAVSGNVTLHFTFGDQVLALSTVGEKSLATHYYRAILRRDPDTDGKAFWEGEAARAATLGANPNEAWYAMAATFFASPEYAAFNRSDDDFLTDVYKTFFNRAPDTGGLAYWKGQMSSGITRDMIIAAFTFSPEFTSFTQAIFGTAQVRAEIDMVTDMYRGWMRRLPDDQGFQFWVGKLRAAQCLPSGQAAAVKQAAEDLAHQFLASAEYLARSRTDAGYLADLYNAVQRRGGDVSGVTYWLSQLASGALTRDAVLTNTVLYSGEFTSRVNRVLAQGCLH